MLLPSLGWAFWHRTNWKICLFACGGLEVGEFVDLKFRVVVEKVMEFVLEIKRWFEELFDGYLVEESMR